jgi:hypothetical protein
MFAMRSKQTATISISQPKLNRVSLKGAFLDKSCQVAERGSERLDVNPHPQL